MSVDTLLEYYANLLRKISHKKYEFYVVSKIIHLLDDREIEFTTQQVIRRKDGRYLIDLYFPQFKLAIEVDEPYHLSQKEQDKFREREIVELADVKIERVEISSLDRVDRKIKEIVQKIQSCKLSLKHKGEFKPFDFDKQFDFQQWIDRGELSVSDQAKFRTHADVLRLFGKDYKVWQKAIWSLDDEVKVWFPKLYSNKEWDNDLIDDGKTILQKKVQGEMLIDESKLPKYLVFAHQTDIFGKTYYVFKGIFECVERKPKCIKYERISECLKLADYSKN